MHKLMSLSVGYWTGLIQANGFVPEGAFIMAYPIIDTLTGAWIVIDGQMVAAADPAAQFCFAPTEKKNVL